MNEFHSLSHSTIKEGQLDLYDWYEQKEVLLLDGEWEFYPSKMVMDNNKQVNQEGKLKKYIYVPSSWNDHLHNEKQTPFGFGSYRLQIKVPPDTKTNYSIYIPSVRSASELYVNGELLAHSGQVGKIKQQYEAKNLPYVTTFSADKNGVIDLVIQVSNFKDVRNSGIVRSIKFGQEAVMAKERNLSLAMQVLASGIFLIHAIYALIIFFLGNREKRLLYFSLLLFCVTLMSTISSDEKLFHLLFDIEYDWAFRIVNATGLVACFALLMSFNHNRLRYWHILKPLFITMYVISIVIMLLLSPGQIIKSFPFYLILVIPTVIIVCMTIYSQISKSFKDNILLVLSIIAIIHHFSWNSYWNEIGISVVHYPIDLIVSIGCFASVWFKNYFTMHIETEKLAIKLQKVNERKDQFLANTSHEFKNPLHGIINMSQSILMREKGLLKEKSIHELETIFTVGKRMSLLLNDLLDVASLKDGKPRLKKDNIQLQPIVNGVIDMLEFIIEMKPIKIVNEVAEDFPPIYADENRVMQIIYNLLHNAVKYTHEGNVYIKAKAQDDKVFISITDTGSGINEKFLDRLFLPYEQEAGEVIVEGGFGLGLSISKQLIELHGGKLEVSSVPGEGSTFTFPLKLAQTKGSKTAETKNDHAVVSDEYTDHLLNYSASLNETEVSPPTEQQNFSGERIPILVVDDDPVNLQVIKTSLSDIQFDVTTVLSGKEALEKLNEREWGIIISDIMMPEMSGYELTEIIRKRYSFTDLPILLLTARSDQKDIQAGFLAGANDYVTKPVELLELKSRVQALITVKNAVQEQLKLEAAWLQAQIQPHFLFNTLSSIIALSSIDLNKMNNLLIELSEFLRAKFEFHPIDELVSVKEELKIVRSYLNIEQVRFGDRLHVEWQIDEYDNIKIPFLTIQPLVENAVRHGVMQYNDGGKVIIKLANYENYVEISVEDNGVGMEENKRKNLLNKKENDQSGIGLVNTNKRLIRHFGTGLKIKSTPNKGTFISFIVKK